MIPALTARQTSSPCQLNLTALLDVVLQLIIFFILVSQLGLEDRPDLALPDLQDPQVQRTGQDQRLFVNLISTAPRADDDSTASTPAGLAAIKIHDQTYSPGQLPAVTELVARSLEKAPGLEVLVRADAALPYQAVGPVLEAIRVAGAKDVGLIALAR